MEVKNAFTVLSDSQQRADYDRKLGMVSAELGQGMFLYFPRLLVLHGMLLDMVEQGYR